MTVHSATKHHVLPHAHSEALDSSVAVPHHRPETTYLAIGVPDPFFFSSLWYRQRRTPSYPSFCHLHYHCLWWSLLRPFRVCNLAMADGLGRFFQPVGRDSVTTRTQQERQGIDHGLEFLLIAGIAELLRSGVLPLPILR